MEKHYIQVGVTALRAPNGEFLQSVPLYVEAEMSADILTPIAVQTSKDVSGIFAERYQQVMNERKRREK